jgi:hypothetical protein
MDSKSHKHIHGYLDTQPDAVAYAHTGAQANPATYRRTGAHGQAGRPG